MHHLENIGFCRPDDIAGNVSNAGRKKDRTFVSSSLVANSHNVHPTILFQIKDRNLEAKESGASQIHPDPLSAPLLLLTRIKRGCFLQIKPAMHS